MRLQIFRYLCADCGEEFKAPNYAGTEYGLLLMRGSRSDSLRRLDAFDDPVYSEVSDLLAAHPQVGQLSDVRQADVLQRVFGTACDPDELGGEFKIGIPPLCPRCGSRRMQHFSSTEEFVDLDVPPVSHDAWSQLSQPERLHRLDEAVRADLAR